MRKVEPIKYETGMYMLVGAIVKSALACYCRDVEKEVARQEKTYITLNAKKGRTELTKKQVSMLENKRYRLEQDKAEAELFFKSKMFQATNLNFEYLYKHRKEILWGYKG